MTTLHISLVGRTDLSGEIYRQIRQVILAGKLKPGDRLPATRVLAKSLEVSRSTVTTAYERLLAEGLVASRIGAATFVSQVAAPPHRVARHGVPVAALRAKPFWDTVTISVAFTDEAPFDFRMGIPDVTVFPHDAWRRSVVRALRSDEMMSGVYGSAAGLRSLRESIADHIGVSRSVRASPDDVIVTNGTQQALDIVARILLEPGDTVAVEDPGYGPPRHLFKSSGARVVGIPVDADGLVVDRLPTNARMVYVTPSHQFPLGIAMSLRRRRALLSWAERHNAAIIEDDYDSEFRFSGRPLEPLQTLDVAGRVIYISSFSKTMLPALRLGFLVIPPSLHAAAEKAKFVTDWHSSTLVQAALARFIAGGSFARHLRTMNRLYRERHQIVSDVIARELGDHLELIPASTGLHVAALAKTASVAALASLERRAAELGVAFQQVASYAVDAPPRPGITIGYGRIPTARIAEGLRRLRECFT
jgi:GntR family transcriptional regulator / MocR family aminotransferase